MVNIEYYVVELLVRNHPGVMTHITGLFARRGFNLEGILCGQVEDGSKSRMYLLVKNDNVLPQIVKQLEKLYDVLELSVHHNYDYNVFLKLGEILKIQK